MKPTLALLGAAFISYSTLHAETAYALDSRNILIRFDTANPGFTEDSRVIRGLTPGEALLGIDFRPTNGRLYALGSSSRLYTIDTATGMATAVGSGPFSPALEGTEFGFDFNPTVDRIRVVSNTGQNLRLHPDTGMVAATDGRINSDGNAGYRVVGSAYTNSVAGATATVLYNIDGELRALLTQVPPNDGKVNMVGMMQADISEVAGFDISPRANLGYMAGRVRGTAASGLWEVELATGLARLIGLFDRHDQVGGLAIPGR